MSYNEYSAIFGALMLTLACASDGEQTPPASGGTQGTGAAGSGGNAGSGGSADSGGSGAESGNAGAAGTAGSTGAGTGGQAGSSGDAGTGGEAGGNDPGSCTADSGDDVCAQCLKMNCCGEWLACAEEPSCSACAECLDTEADLGTCVVMAPPLCNFTGDDVTARMLACGLEQCEAACGFD